MYHAGDWEYAVFSDAEGRLHAKPRAENRTWGAYYQVLLVIVLANNVHKGHNTAHKVGSLKRVCAGFLGPNLGGSCGMLSAEG